MYKRILLTEKEKYSMVSIKVSVHLQTLGIGIYTEKNFSTNIYQFKANKRNTKKV